MTYTIDGIEVELINGEIRLWDGHEITVNLEQLKVAIRVLEKSAENIDAN